MVRSRSQNRRHQGGFTYVGLLILIAVFALISAETLRAGMTAQRRVAEQELLDSGWRLTQALESYARATPAGQNPVPRTIEDLLRDPRSPTTTVRHLRRVEFDPITAQAQWGIVRTPDGRGIDGFHSLSTARPWRKDFVPPFTDFADKPLYRDWVFTLGLGE
jgi:type II secretory pathway pseudopilin PulG